MIALLPILFVAAALQPGIDAVSDEETAARALDAHVICMARAIHGRRDDRRAIETVAAEAVAQCATEATHLQASMLDVFRRKPERLPAGSTPEEAANAYVEGWTGRAEVALRELRGRN